MEEKIRARLEELRGSLQNDDGDLEIVEISGKNVTIRLVGACGCCPNSTVTLKDVIERDLREKIDPKIVVTRK